MYLLTITSVFLSTPSARRATVRPARIVISTMYFYPRPPRGGRLLLVVSPGRRCTFLSTPSARRATFVPSRLLWEHFEFLSTPSARRATGFGAQTPSGGYDFYPRPPRGGRPPTPSARRATSKISQIKNVKIYFYPRPPRGGRPAERRADCTASGRFLSTPSARRATKRSGSTAATKRFLSTPSARRATRGAERREHRL